MKLLDQVRHVPRLKHRSYRTEQAYVDWAEKYVRFHGIRHPAEVEQFLTHLAVVRHVSAGIQNQALCALIFLFDVRLGLRLTECCRLRVKDIDLGRGRITVRGGKGDKDRRVMLPAARTKSEENPGEFHTVEKAATSAAAGGTE